MQVSQAIGSYQEASGPLSCADAGLLDGAGRRIEKEKSAKIGTIAASCSQYQLQTLRRQLSLSAMQPDEHGEP